MIVQLKPRHRNKPAPQPSADHSAELHALRVALLRLDTRSRLVLTLRFQRPPVTLADVGALIGGVGRERVRQIEGRALMRLQEDLRWLRQRQDLGITD